MSDDASTGAGRDEGPTGAETDEGPTGAETDEGTTGADGDETSHVVTAFLRNSGEVLLLRRSDAVGTYGGRWGGVSGYAEGGPDAQVRVEIAEETGLEDAVSFGRSGRPVGFTDPDLEPAREWVVHPYLFDCDDREVDLSAEHDAFEWVPPTAMLGLEFEDESAASDRRDGDPIGETVPELWTAYERVAPTVRSIAADDDHGAAYLSIRALEVLRDRAGLIVAERDAGGADPDAEGEELAELARRLLEARPSMAVLRNRVNRAMAEAAGVGSGRADGEESGGADGEESAGGSDGDGADATDGLEGADATAVLEAALAGIGRALEADRGAAERAREYADGTVLTLSRSGTVLEALRAGDPARVYVAESRPGLEGVGVAEELRERSDGETPVTLHTDAAAAHLLANEDVDRVLVGADTVLADGRVVNKTGTRGIAVVAAREGVPVYAVAASDKVSTREGINLESGDREAVYDGDASLDVANPTFDVTPPECVAGIVTERGALESDDVAAVAAELRAFEDWRTAF